MSIIAQEHFVAAADAKLEDGTASGLTWLNTNTGLSGVGRIAVPGALRPYNNYPNEGAFYLETSVVPPNDSEVGLTWNVLAPSVVGDAGYLVPPPTLCARMDISTKPGYFAHFGTVFGTYPHPNGSYDLFYYNPLTGPETLGTYALTVAEGQVYKVAIRCVGTTISLRINDVPVISVTDSRATSGYSGIYIPNNGPWYSDTAPWTVDDWYLDTLLAKHILTSYSVDQQAIKHNREKRKKERAERGCFLVAGPPFPISNEGGTRIIPWIK